VPSRELASQLVAWAKRLVASVQGLQWNPNTFANSIQLAIPDSSEKPNTTPSSTLPWLLIGTPNCLQERLDDMLNADKNNTKVKSTSIQVGTLILDEVDHLMRLPRKYAPEKEKLNRQNHPKPAELLTRAIFSMDSPIKPQLLACSATLNRAIRHFLISNRWVKSSPEIIYSSADTTNGIASKMILDKNNEDAKGGIALPANLQHHCLLVNKETIRNLSMEEETPGRYTKSPFNKRIALQHCTDDQLLEAVLTASELDHARTVLLFIPSTSSVAAVVKRLQTFGAPAEPLTMSVLTNKSSSSSLRILVTTEAAGRGLDLPDVTHVFILGVPTTPAAYLHMAGRTARMGRPGVAITLLLDNQNSIARMRTMARTVQLNWTPFAHVG
jgi:superfamily II DNA/RNA helicase